MNYFLYGLALLACVGAAQGYEHLKEREGHYLDLRPRLGHFKEAPFIDLYKTYAAAFVAPLHPDRPDEDYRNYLPSGDECMVFLRAFRFDKYVLKDLDDMIVLDACLGYLYESTYHEKDTQESAQIRDNLKGFKDDATLKSLYEQTTINSLADDGKECIGNLLLDAVRAKKQYSDKGCNNHWLGLFNRFAECQRRHVPSEWRTSDIYGTTLYDLVKARAKECFNFEIYAINRAVREDYANNPFTRVTNVFTAKFNKFRRQAGERYWPKEVIELLRAVQGTNKEINSREVSNIVRGVAENHPEFKDRLLRNMAKHADARINPALNSKATAADPHGDKRYRAMVDGMCNFFRQSDYDGFYDFATPFVRMVKMLEFPEIFDISEKYMITQVLLQSFETSCIYLSVSSCNILTFTEAQFEKSPANHALHYQVKFLPDTSAMIQWPNAGFY